MFDSVPMIHWSPRQDSMSFLRILSFALDLHNIGGLSSNFRGVCPLYEQRDVVTFQISGENIRGGQPLLSHFHSRTQSALLFLKITPQHCHCVPIQ